MKRTPKWLTGLLLLALSALSCQASLIDWSLFNQPTPAPGSGPTATPTPLAELTFNLTLPAPAPAGSTVYLAALDEVTGLALNPLLYAMQMVDAQHYTLKLPVTLGSVVKYRYVLQGPVNAQEMNALNSLVRYRLAYADSPRVVEDLLTGWGAPAYSAATGGLSGIVTDSASGQPLVNILVSAGGVSTLTDSLGQYTLRGIVPGKHLLSAYALDGAYLPFQQEAAINANVDTPAVIHLQPARSVKVTFNVTVPADTVVGAPLRLAGNLLSLGNTFADLGGGVSVIASHLPSLTPLDATHFTLTLELPVGADVRYKYSLGDGFWNAEHASDGSFTLRQLIVPDRDTVINDTVITWKAGSSAPMVFDVTVPASTPITDTISIQFNAYGWAEALPMWPMGGSRWVYQLYGAPNLVGDFTYRYCRNDQCGAADDVQTANGQGRRAATSLTAENFQDTVSAWQWLPADNPSSLAAVSVMPHAAGFAAGVEFQGGYSPSWQAQYPNAMLNVQGLGANTLVYTPSWSVSFSNPLTMAPLPGRDPLWNNALETIAYARALNFSTLVYPSLQFNPNAAEFWRLTPRSPQGWQDWFDRYRAFALYHADLAAKGGAQGLILGGEEIFPSLPGGLLPDGSPSGVPDDAEARWRSLLTEIRQHFNGRIYWAHPYRDTLPPAPAFIDAFDGIYLLWSVPLGANANDLDSMTAEAARRMESDLLPFLAQTHKSVILALYYPSAAGTDRGCIASGLGGCLDPRALERPAADVPGATLDTQTQFNLYQAVLNAINTREWIGGLIARGYYPPAALMDKSASVRNKPTGDLLWYWFPRLLGK